MFDEWEVLLYSNLPLKYARIYVHIPIKCAILSTKIVVHALLSEHVMQSHLLRKHEFLTLDIQC